MSRVWPPQFGHLSGNSSPTRAMSFAHAIRDVSCERGFSFRPSTSWPPPQGIEKIKTIGDARMAAAALPEPRAEVVVKGKDLVPTAFRIGRKSGRLPTDLESR